MRRGGSRFVGLIYSDNGGLSHKKTSEHITLHKTNGFSMLSYIRTCVWGNILERKKPLHVLGMHAEHKLKEGEERFFASFLAFSPLRQTVEPSLKGAF